MLRLSLLLFLAGAALAPTGCGSPAPRQYDDQTIAASDMFRKISTAYMQAYRTKKKPPTSDDLKPFLKEHGETIASLVSPRDQKPIVLVPFVPDNRLGEGEEPILAYEAEGINGERMLVDSRGLVRVEKAEDFARIRFPGGHKPK
ncbi:hypothetical protein J8F10_33045 [Gemmata sp. G18]|uniref:Uncharacterized protein n=1 Tax=Gemmata palustris TaxID=2822762 RepID=A0ABS5C3M0_9BACT|nr:hypothetical protein [Gemmata palustris]MBP3960080.1 hypothetical protein [Gemmata palustris]